MDTHKYTMVYPNGDTYQFPVLTQQHIKWCRDGEIAIFDMQTDMDCINGNWIKNNTHEN